MNTVLAPAKSGRGLSTYVLARDVKISAGRTRATRHGYAKLRESVRETLLLGQQKIEQEKVRTYWESGRLINDHLARHTPDGKERAEYNRRVIENLAKDLDLGRDVLYRCAQFAQQFKKVDARRLSWTHYRTLLVIPDEKTRERLASQADKSEWTTGELEEKVKKISASFATSSDGRSKSRLIPQDSRPKTELLKPKKGELFTYQIVKDAGQLAIDHGFTSFWNLSAREAARFSEGDIVRMLPDGKLQKLNLQRRTARSLSADAAVVAHKAQLYTYEADVVRVVDGDTIWMKIYLEGRNRPAWLKEKLRLRDIDAPELYKKADAAVPHEMSKSRRAVHNPPGLRAKKFVEEQIAGKRVVITTTKPDKWDRYLSDVFLTKPDGAELFLNNLLLEHGHARIKTDWSLSDWEEDLR